MLDRTTSCLRIGHCRRLFCTFASRLRMTLTPWHTAEAAARESRYTAAYVRGDIRFFARAQFARTYNDTRVATRPESIRTLRDCREGAGMAGVSETHPRPQLQRARWESLDGRWDFALDPDGDWSLPGEVTWDRSIIVPFAPETLLSGVAAEGFFRSCWYRRTVEIAPAQGGERIFLMFGADDHSARVWVDGAYAGCHEGGYTPFSIDITDFLLPGTEHEIILCAEDDPHDLAKPRGKQDWQLEPHSIWYPRTTGIWQTVWLEVVPATALSRLTFTPHLARWEIGVGAWVDGVPHERLRLSVTLTCGGVVLAGDTYTVISGEVHRRVALSDPGIDDSRNELLWSPHAPTLIDVQLDLWGE